MTAATPARHDLECDSYYVTGHGWTGCTCNAIRDTRRIQTENRDHLEATADPDKDQLLRWINQHRPDVLREALNETGRPVTNTRPASQHGVTA